MVDKKSIAIISAVLLAFFEVGFVIYLVFDFIAYYAFPVFYINSTPILLVSILSLAMLALMILAVYHLIRNFAPLKTVAIIFCLLIGYVANIPLTLLPGAVCQSYTNDIDDYQILDERAETVLKNEVGGAVFDFGESEIVSYEYAYREGAFLYQYLKIELTAVLSNEDYQRYTEWLLNSERVNGEGSNYVLLMNESLLEENDTKNCVIYTCDEKREISVLILIEYVR